MCHRFIRRRTRNAADTVTATNIRRLSELNVADSLFKLSFIAPTLLVGRQERHLACKKLGVGLLTVTI